VARNVRGEGRLDTGLVLVCVALSVLAFLSPRRTREDVATMLRATVLSPLVQLEGRAATIRAAVVARNDLLVTRGRAVTDTLSLRAISDENKTLRQLLGLSARLQDGFVPAELLPIRGGDEFSIALTVGSDVGVQPYQPVVTADGLVGMVVSVDRTTSTALTWAHPDFRVSVMSSDQNAFGIVQPHLAEGAERWLLEMRGVPFRAKLDTGTLIVSSGLGATYPRGIPVGTVIGELSTPEKWARTYLVKPAVLTENIGPVLVFLPGRAQRGVNGVWTSVAAADSAARAVAAAGDSLARVTALDELAARRAALDSLTADSLSLADTIGGGLTTRPDSTRRVDSARARRPDSGAVRAPSPPRGVAPRPPLSRPTVPPRERR
jgi:rod shape-determining protein MreC